MTQYTSAHFRPEVGIETPCWHCETQATLNCWCVHTGIASAYLSVAMVKSHGRLYPVSRRGTVREYRLSFQIYIPCIPCHIGRGTDSTPRSQDNHGIECIPGRGHSTTSCPRLAATVQQRRTGNGFTRAECGRGDHTPRCILVVASA